MKELSTEEKAKRYDEAIKRAKEINGEHSKKGFKPSADALYIFPELAESEDERIRKSLLAYIKGDSKKLDTTKWIAWLEKQGELIENNMLLPFKEYDNLMDSINKKKKEGYEAGYKQGLIDSKSEHKIKPKFKNGDRVRNKKSGLEQTLGSCIKDVYEGAFPFRIKDQDDWELVEQKPVEWSKDDETNIGRAIDIIKNAKEGLSIYKTDDGIYECEQAIKVLDKLLKNGYSVLWNEMDYANIEKLIKILPQCIFRHPHILDRDECRDLVSWLKSLKERVQPKQDWSEEDRDLIEEIISHYRHLIAIGSLDSEHYKSYIIPKLKSILSQNH